jgi:uncharacterized protein YecT (DUF1311 family)
LADGALLHALAAFSLAQAGPPPDPGWNCEEPQLQQEMNWCAAEDYARADAALNRQWKETRAAMKRRDAEAPRYGVPFDGQPGFFASLLEAQRAWLAWRDAHCRLEGYEARGGSLEPLLVSTCKARLTRARTAQLLELAAAADR